MPEFINKHRVMLLLVSAVSLIWLCYWQTVGHTLFWDTNHIFSNEALRSLSLDSVYWILTNTVVSNWHPVTLMTHALDFSLFGANPSGHHLVNVLIHCAVTIVVFFSVRQLAGLRADRQSSFYIAAVATLVFALHPLRVESVAWVAARKDLLYSFFYLLSIMAYVGYAKESSGDGSGDRRALLYKLALACFALSLMSKSMAVTLPAVLVLLDYYPLARLDIRRPMQYLRREFADKLPFVLLSLVLIVITLATQSEAMAARLTPWDQLRNMTHNIVFYLERLLAPVGLVPFYPFPDISEFYSYSYWLLQAGFILAFTALSMVQAWRGQPLLFTCWMLYLTMLSPASGVIHVGSAVAADRYTYLSQLPIVVLLAIGAVWFWQRFEKLRRVWVVAGMLGLLTLVSLTFMQVGHWKNPITLWSHVLRVYPDTSLAHRNLGTAYFNAGDYDSALAHVDILAAQGWPVAPLLVEALNAAGRQQQGLSRYKRLLAQPGLSEGQRQTYSDIIRLLEEDRTVTPENAQ